MSRKVKNNYGDEYESDEYDDTETLISRNKPPRYKSAPVKKAAKKSARRPGSPIKGKAKTGKDLWMNAIKNRQTLGRSSGRHADSPRHKTPIEYWADTLRKTGVGMSTESTGMNSLTGLKKTNDLNLAYLSTPHYMRQMMGTEKGKRNVEDPTAKPMAGTPAYKSQEEYYEQILDLKKVISGLQQDNSTMKAKVRRLEEDNIKKEKQIEGYLHPEKNEELRRTMGDRKPDTGAVIHSLKQKILKLEMQLRDKEASYVKMASELKTTKVEEMKIQMEVLYQEVLRLQNSRETGVDKSSRQPKEGSAKIKALNETVIRLSKTNEQIQAENKGLKEDLQKALEGTEEGSTSARREHEDMNRRQLLSEISKLQRRAERAERRIEADNTSMLSLDSRRSEVQGKIVLEGTLENRLHQLDQRETELLEQVEKLKRDIRRLKDDKERTRRRESTSATPRQNSPPSATPRQRRSSSVDRQSRVDNFSQKHAATSIQRHWRERRQRQIEEDEERKVQNFQQNHAAKAIQNRWRRHHREEEEDDAAYMIQSALRGHHARRRELQRYQNDYDSDIDESTGSDDAVFLIQSSLKGHRSRRENMRRMKQMRLDSTGEEDDDESYHHGHTGGQRSRRPSSAQSRGSYKKTTYASYSSSRHHGLEDDDDIMM